ncbi:MAG TPA: ankyrin repeat domain-containing protein [Rhodocyclaceae bacterium]|nr:ankyrin repeat domain-containing protein [Rhodocyclaceae bacterium]
MTLNALLAAIVDDNQFVVSTLLKTNASLAQGHIDEPKLYDIGIFHWVYRGDTPLHLAAAGYRAEIVQLLLKAGADPNSYANHRRSGPIHYAADGYITGPAWDAAMQVRTIRRLLEAGANINAPDMNGATPLHRAVRTRCAVAVEFLLSAGADALARNKSGSTPFHLAVQNTGRGGSGEFEAKEAQQQIIETFLSVGVSTGLVDGKGNSVLECAKSSWIRQILAKH